MSRRSISDSQRKWLEQELADWQSTGLLTQDQSAQIRDLYESAEEVGHRKRSVFSFVILGLAAFLMGLALFLLIGHNWDAIPRATKLLLIFGAILGTHAAGLYLRFTRLAPRASEIVVFLGCLFYGAGIWLVAQVYHISAHYPDGMWWWAIGVLPFALCLDTVLLHCLLVALLGIWAGMEVIGFTNLGARLFWGWWSVPNGAYSLPLLAFPGLIWAYRKNSPLTVGLYVPLLAWWVILQAIAWDLEWQTVYVVACTGAMLLIVAECHRDGSRLAVPIRFWGVFLAAGALIPLSYGDFHKGLMRDTWGYQERSLVWVAQLAPLFILLAVMLPVCLYFLRPRGGGDESAGERLLTIIRRQWLPAALLAGMAALSLWSSIVAHTGTPDDWDASWLVPTLVANAGMVGVSLWLMRVGLREDRGRPFTVGVVYFLLWSVLRYFDLFAQAGGMLGAAVMFLLCGAIMFGVGIFWRGRKQARHA